MFEEGSGALVRFWTEAGILIALPGYIRYGAAATGPSASVMHVANISRQQSSTCRTTECKTQ